MNKYQFVTGLHGNERMPVLALAAMGVPQIVGNPRALAENKRYLEKDLNAAFGTFGNSLEERRAREIMKMLNRKQLVIDMHTAMSVKEPVVIIVDKKMLDLAQMTGIKRILFMKYNNKDDHALINVQSGISIECGIHDTKEAFENAIEVINSLKSNRKTGSVTIYQVYGPIMKPGSYINFKKHKDGFIPVFAMKNSYNNFGLMAKIIKKEDL